MKSKAQGRMENSPKSINRDPTFLGHIVSVSGSALEVQLAKSVSSGLSIIDGQTYKIGQVGSFVRVPQGYQDLFGVVSGVGASAVSENNSVATDTGRWMKVELVGEVVGARFDRGISQYPNVGDHVHLAVERHLRRIYDVGNVAHVEIGVLSSAATISAQIALNELVTRHSAILGTTGSGKSTTVASLLRSIATGGQRSSNYPSARILLLDLHGEYAEPLSDISQSFSADPDGIAEPLNIPFWALETRELLEFLIGGLEGPRETAFTDKIFELKTQSFDLNVFDGLDGDSITVDTPIPFSLKKLWYELLDFEIRTFEGPNRDEPAQLTVGDADSLIPPTYKLHGMGAAGPFLNQEAVHIRRPLNLIRSRLLDRRFDFLLHPGRWEPNLDGTPEKDLDELLRGWLGGPKPITVLDFSDVPSANLERLIGSILKIVYEALFWSREKSEGGVARPLLIVMEEAHRYLSPDSPGLASVMCERIVKEGRKYGVGAMVVSQRPAEVSETILSQCGTFFTMRLSNPIDRARVRGTLPDGLLGLLDVLPILQTGEVIVTGECAKLPMRCRVTLPEEKFRPRSSDPNVSANWALQRREEGYERVVNSWRSQNPRAVAHRIELTPVEDHSEHLESER